MEREASGRLLEGIKSSNWLEGIEGTSVTIWLD